MVMWHLILLNPGIRTLKRTVSKSCKYLLMASLTYSLLYTNDAHTQKEDKPVCACTEVAGIAQKNNFISINEKNHRRCLLIVTKCFSQVRKLSPCQLSHLQPYRMRCTGVSPTPAQNWLQQEKKAKKF